MSKLKLIPTENLKHVRTIANMRLNNISAEIYRSNNDKSWIVADKFTHQIPYASIEFDSLDNLESWIEKIPGSGVGKLDNILEILLDIDI